METDEIKLELERIRGDIKNLETVIRNSILEQKTLNLKHEKSTEQMNARMGRVESKLWWIQGILGSTGVAMTVMVVRLLTMLK